MPHVIEPAPTARAKCRGCGEKISAGALRFGESVPNPFAEGETFQWFHLDCAAFKRPAPYLETLAAAPEPLADAERLRPEAQAGLDHHRLPRVNGAERAPSGRAQCRSCRNPIDKGAWRINLVFYEEGRFANSGSIHVPCAAAYLESTDVMPRLKRFSPSLGDADLEEIRAQLQGAAR